MENNEDMETLGRKFDTGKPEFTLIPPTFLLEVVKVLTAGKQKYAANNWVYVEGAKKRYHDALQRHLNAVLRGEILDPETGLSHYAHMTCCIAFLFELEHVLTQDHIDKKIPLPYI